MKAALAMLAAIWVAIGGLAFAADEPDADAPGIDGLVLDGPGSIADQYQKDRGRKEYLFQIPGMDAIVTPWSKLRSNLDQNHGFKPTISSTHLYQKASDTVGPEDDAAGYELVVDGTWNFAGRGGDSATTLGFEFLYRDFTSDTPPDN